MKETGNTRINSMVLYCSLRYKYGFMVSKCACVCIRHIHRWIDARIEVYVPAAVVHSCLPPLCPLRGLGTVKP